MKNLIIIAAGSFGREVAGYASQCLGYGTEWKLKGFIDSDLRRLDEHKTVVPIIGTIDDYVPEPNDVFFCAIGNTSLKEKFIGTIKNKGGKFHTLIHRSVVISDVNVQIGEGCFIGPYCCISCDTLIEDYVTLNCYVELGHDVKLRKLVHVNTFAFFGGFSEAGEGAIIHPHAVITPGKLIGKNAVVGAGSIVIKNVKPGTTVFGSPAKSIFDS
jgi:sugar O-acyltransferase (sialic acid O-acetyltransferase NeuD family)